MVWIPFPHTDTKEWPRNVDTFLSKCYLLVEKLYISIITILNIFDPVLGWLELAMSHVKKVLCSNLFLTSNSNSQHLLSGNYETAKHFIFVLI